MIQKAVKLHVKNISIYIIFSYIHSNKPTGFIGNPNNPLEPKKADNDNDIYRIYYHIYSII